MKLYYTRFDSGESQGVDAFSVSWRKGRGFFHPPVGLLSRVMRKAESKRAKGVLVAPDWPGSGWLAVVEEKARMKKLRLAEKMSLVLEFPKEIVSDMSEECPRSILMCMSLISERRKK